MMRQHDVAVAGRPREPLVGRAKHRRDTHAKRRAQMHGAEVHFCVDLGLGSSQARAWGCDLTEAYVVENSSYST